MANVINYFLVVDVYLIHFQMIIVITLRDG